MEYNKNNISKVSKHVTISYDSNEKLKSEGISNFSSFVDGLIDEHLIKVSNNNPSALRLKLNNKQFEIKKITDEFYKISKKLSELTGSKIYYIYNEVREFKE